MLYSKANNKALFYINMLISSIDECKDILDKESLAHLLSDIKLILDKYYKIYFDSCDEIVNTFKRLCKKFLPTNNLSANANGLYASSLPHHLSDSLEEHKHQQNR